MPGPWRPAGRTRGSRTAPRAPGRPAASSVRRVQRASQRLPDFTQPTFLPLPADLRHLIAHDEPINGSGNKYSLRVNEYAEVETILARLRERGAVIDEMQLQQADLEDIFIQIMEEGKQ